MAIFRTFLYVIHKQWKKYCQVLENLVWVLPLIYCEASPCSTVEILLSAVLVTVVTEGDVLTTPASSPNSCLTADVSFPDETCAF